MQRVSPYLSDAILSCFRQVNVQRGMWFREFNRKRIDYPQAWAPEGDVFCSTYEGITCFSIGRVEEI